MKHQLLVFELANELYGINITGTGKSTGSAGTTLARVPTQYGNRLDRIIQMNIVHI